jgi:hypothetical protein
LKISTEIVAYGLLTGTFQPKSDFPATPSVPLKVSPGKRVCEGGTFFQRHFQWDGGSMSFTGAGYVGVGLDVMPFPGAGYVCGPLNTATCSDVYVS